MLKKDKLYYTIGDVSKILNLPPSLIRFWEKKFSIINPIKKNKSSKRKYKLKDIEAIFKIKTLLKKENYTIKGAVKQLESWTPEYSYEEFVEILSKSEEKIEKHNEQELLFSEIKEDHDQNTVTISKKEYEKMKEIILKIYQIVKKES